MVAAFYFSLASFLVFAAVYILTRKALLYGIKLVGVLAIANVLFLFGQASVILSDTELYMLFFTRFQAVGYMFIPVLWYLISVQQKHQSRKFSIQFILLMILVPAISFVSMMIYPWDVLSISSSWVQKLYYVSHYIAGNTFIGVGYSGIVFVKGIIFYALLAFNIVVYLLAMVNYIHTFRRSLESSKLRILWLVLMTIVLVLFMLFGYISPSTVLIDALPVATSAFSIVLFFSLYKQELFDLIPIAYRQVFDDFSFPVIIFDKGLYILSMNRKAKALYKDQFDFNAPFCLADFNQFEKGFSDKLLQLGYYVLEVSVRDREVYYQIKLEELFKFGHTIGYLMTYQDITMHKLEMRKMEYMATYDDLTGILNRRVFFSKAMQAFDETVIHKSSLSFIMFDLDNFKDVNDIYGHLAGDYVLASLSKLCKKLMNDSMIFARYGGEEFVVFLGGVAPIDAYDLATELKACIEKNPFVYEKHRIFITGSFGISGTGSTVNRSFEQYLKDADEALYEAKKNGKNQVYIKE